MSKAEAKVNEEMSMLEIENTPRIILDQSKETKVVIVGSKARIIDLNAEPNSDSDSEGEEENSQILAASNPQDANDHVSKLYYELHAEIFARGSCSKYWKLNFLNNKFKNLLQSKQIFKLRQERGLVKPYVMLLTGDINRWTMFDSDFKTHQRLPEIQSDYCFLVSDKETICAGTHLLVIGREIESVVVWRYKLEMGKWFKGPGMITPRVLYGSASRGADAFFAGGVKINADGTPEIVTLAEKYNADTETWTALKGMNKRRNFCSACFYQGKFWVIGGRNENDKWLTCGESYDETTDTWELIPEMLKDMVFVSPSSPPLIAVVNDNLYWLKTNSNELHVYDKAGNSWKSLGVAPVRADGVGGWGVAFKSIGDRLLLIGGMFVGSICETMKVFTCCPSTNAENLIWELTHHCSEGRLQFNHFIRACCVMYA